MTRNTKRLIFALTVIYIALVAWIILFKIVSISEILYMSHARTINLIPFHYEQEQPYHLSEVLYNIAIFIPLGFYFKMLKIKSSRAILYGACFSFVLEISQFLFAIGVTDITDLMTNTFGTVLGVMIYSVLAFVFGNHSKMDKVLSILALLCTTLFLALIGLLCWYN